MSHATCSALQLLQEQKPAALKRAFEQAVKPRIQTARNRDLVRYVFDRVLLMKGGLELDGIKWFHDRVEAIAESVGEKLRTVERSINKLRQDELIRSQPQWRTERGKPRRVNHWTLGQQVIDWLLEALGLAVASTAVVAEDQPADMAEHGTANLAGPIEETRSPSTESIPRSRVPAPAPQASPEQPKGRKTPRPKPTAARRTRDWIKAEEQRQAKIDATPAEAMAAARALGLAMAYPNQ